MDLTDIPAFKGTYKGLDVEGMINLDKKELEIYVHDQGALIYSTVITMAEAELAGHALLSTMGPLARELGDDFAKWLALCCKALAPKVAQAAATAKEIPEALARRLPPQLRKRLTGK